MGRTSQSQVKWLDFNEISILLALEANQPEPSHAKSASEILAMRRAGEGWKAIARALGTAVDGSCSGGVCKLLAGIRSNRGGEAPIGRSFAASLLSDC